jgi:hypothetical protein
MKQTIIIFAILIMATHCSAFVHKNGPAIPKVVQNAFSRQYPKEDVKKWQTADDTCIAKFRMNKRRCHAYYLRGGDWVKTETKIPWPKDLPAAVRKSFYKSAYADGYVIIMLKIETPSGKMYMIDAHYERGPEESIPGDWTDDYFLYYTEGGAHIKTEHFSKN